METIYRDYGSMEGYYYGYPSNSFTYSPRRQVYLATHEGNSSLPLMKRSFISFTYGGRKIEDFNLIACTNGDSLNRAGSAPFNDIVSNYDILNGQQFWNTHYLANTLDLDLVSDGIDLRELEDFLYWFRAGEAKELVLAEHPNRAILARIAQPPHLDLLPFEEKISIPISLYSYNTSTTLYKGHIQLSFVMDEPHWYSLSNILGIEDTVHKRYKDYWIDPDGNEIEVFASKDALKILYEDGIPLGSMIQKNMLLGNGGYANVEGKIQSRIWSIANDEDCYEEDEEHEGLMKLVGEGARIEAATYEEAVFPYELGMIAGAVVDATGEGITTLEPNKYGIDAVRNGVGYFYYSGTAPAPTIISFTFTPEILDGIITSPANKYQVNTEETPSTPYDTITIESRTKLELRITTPNIFTSYNKMTELINKYCKDGNIKTTDDMRQEIREEVRHLRVREWANQQLNALLGNAGTPIVLNLGHASDLKTGMSHFFSAGGTISPVTFTYNSETGEAIGKFTYALVTSPNYYRVYEENIGDSILSNYIIIRDRNLPTSIGAIEGWTSAHPEYSHRIYHNMKVPLKNFSILYKNMYL